MCKFYAADLQIEFRTSRTCSQVISLRSSIILSFRSIREPCWTFHSEISFRSSMTVTLQFGFHATYITRLLYQFTKTPGLFSQLSLSACKRIAWSVIYSSVGIIEKPLRPNDAACNCSKHFFDQTQKFQILLSWSGNYSRYSPRKFESLRNNNSDDLNGG